MFITRIEEANGSGYRVTAQYTYDGLNQLTKETRYTYSGTSTTATDTTVVDYVIDTAGNLRSVTTTVNGTQTDQISYTYGNTAWADKLTAVTVNGTKKTIQYADTLNPKSWYNGTSYTNLTWTQGRRLSSIKKGTETYSYEYDMSGVRSAKVVNGERHEYVTQNGRVVRDYVTYAGTDTFVRCTDFFYDEAGRPFAMRCYYDSTLTGADTFHYVLNAQGDVVQLNYQGGTVYAEYSYDAWGNVTSIKGNSNSGSLYYAERNPLRYRGYYYDTETGFYYLQSRYYDPAVKRFLNADSYGSTGQGFTGFNMFAYCNNNPAICSDPNGQSCLSYTCAFTPHETCGFGGFCCGDSSFSAKALLKTIGNVANAAGSCTKKAGIDAWMYIKAGFITAKKIIHSIYMATDIQIGFGAGLEVSAGTPLFSATIGGHDNPLNLHLQEGTIMVEETSYIGLQLSFLGHSVGPYYSRTRSYDCSVDSEKYGLTDGVIEPVVSIFNGGVYAFLGFSWDFSVNWEIFFKYLRN